MTYQNINGVAYPYKFHSRITSASKPTFTPANSAREKTKILISLGWTRDNSGDRVLFSHSDFYDGAWVYLDWAWEAQYLAALSEKYWGEKA